MNFKKYIYLAGLGMLILSQPSHSSTLTVNASGAATTVVSPTTFNDNIELRFGTGGTTACEWSTTDANANALVCSGPEGGGTDVPVFIFGDATCNALDIGLFDGLTNGTVAAMNDACTGSTYFYHNGTDGAMVTTTGDLLLNISGANLAPSANDGAALGISGTGWSDLFGAVGFVLNLGAGDVTATHSANTLAFAGATSGYSFDDLVTVNKSTVGIGFDLNGSATTYTTATGLVDIVRSGALTGVDTETILDSRIAPSFTLTEPGAGSVNYYGQSIDMSGLAVTAGVGTSVVSALYLNADDDADTGTNYGLFVDGGTTRLDGGIDLDSNGVRITEDSDGAITLLGLGDGFDEDLTLNLDDTENTGTFTSSTALATLNFNSIALQESGNGVINATDCVSVYSMEFNPTETGAINDFVSINMTATLNAQSAFSATETEIDTFMAPVALVARKLRVEVDAAPGAGNDAWIVTLRDDASSTALTCTIDETATNCSDASNAPAIVAGSKLDVLVDSSGAGADPNAAATMNIAFCLGQ